MTLGWLVRYRKCNEFIKYQNHNKGDSRFRILLYDPFVFGFKNLDDTERQDIINEYDTHFYSGLQEGKTEE